MFSKNYKRKRETVEQIKRDAKKAAEEELRYLLPTVDHTNAATSMSSTRSEDVLDLTDESLETPELERSPDLRQENFSHFSDENFSDLSDISFGDLSDESSFELSDESSSELSDESLSNCEHKSQFESSDQNTSSKLDTEEFLRSSLISWALNDGITLDSVTKLLRILNVCMPNVKLPKDARSLLKTRRNISITTLSDGHKQKDFILAEGLLGLLGQNNSGLSHISLLINVDGLPLHKSGKMSFWPILCSINELRSKPCMATLYCGPHKPPLNEFLSTFLTELRDLQENGLQVNGSKVTVSVLAFVCDAPARQFLKQCKGHTGYYGCEKCTVEGVYKNHTMSFNEINCPLRSDTDFERAGNDDPHIHENPSPLVQEGFGLVSHFPLDYMHLVLLGVMRRLISLWTKDHPFKQSQSCIQSINAKMIAFRKFIPEEFARKPRSLSESSSWKATELRLFLLYLGPFILKNKLPPKYYQHFMLLSIAIRILADKEAVKEENKVTYAENLLKKFVSKWGTVYNGNSIVYNVHSLIHLADDVRRTGALDDWSAFRYENYLGCLKRKLRSGNLPLEQICRRIYELNDFKGHLEPGNVEVHFKIDPKKSKDNCVLLNDGTYCIVNSKHGEKITVSKLIKRCECFTKPCKSSILGIFAFKGLDKSSYIRSYSEIQKKCMKIQNKAIYIVIPCLHVVGD